MSSTPGAVVLPVTFSFTVTTNVDDPVNIYSGTGLPCVLLPRQLLDELVSNRDQARVLLRQLGERAEHDHKVEEELSTLMKENTRLLRLVDELTKENEQLREEVNELRRENEELQRQVRKLTKEIEEVKIEIVDVLRRLKATEKENEVFKAKMVMGELAHLLKRWIEYKCTGDTMTEFLNRPSWTGGRLWDEVQEVLRTQAKEIPNRTSLKCILRTFAEFRGSGTHGTFKLDLSRSEYVKLCDIVASTGESNWVSVGTGTAIIDLLLSEEVLGAAPFSKWRAIVDEDEKRVRHRGWEE